PKWGPLTSQRSRLPSDVRTNAPFRVPTRTRTPLIPCSFLSFRSCSPASISSTGRLADSESQQAAQASRREVERSPPPRHVFWIGPRLEHELTWSIARARDDDLPICGTLSGSV